MVDNKKPLFLIALSHLCASFCLLETSPRNILGQKGADRTPHQQGDISGSWREKNREVSRNNLQVLGAKPTCVQQGSLESARDEERCLLALSRPDGVSASCQELESRSTTTAGWMQSSRTGSSLVAQQVKDLVMSLQWLGLLPWCRFDLWPQNLHVHWVWTKKKKKGKKRKLQRGSPGAAVSCLAALEARNVKPKGWQGGFSPGQRGMLSSGGVATGLP